jgi:hypothetical protein
MTEQPENGFNVVVRTLTDLGSGRLEWERALAESDPEERAAAIRILRFRKGRCVADLDQVDGELRDLERRHPGIGDD